MNIKYPLLPDLAVCFNTILFSQSWLGPLLYLRRTLKPQLLQCSAVEWLDRAQTPAACGPDLAQMRMLVPGWIYDSSIMGWLVFGLVVKS